MMRTREDGATIKEDFDNLIVVCVGSQDLAYSLLFLLLVLIDVDNVDDIDNVGHSYLSQKMKLLNFDDLNKLQLGDSHVSTFKPKLQGNR